MKTYFSNLFIFLTFLILHLCGSCDSCTNPKEKSHPKTIEINNINFFLDKTESMQGYLNGSAGFANDFPNILVDIQYKINNGRPIRIYYASDSIEKYKKNTEDFNNEISTTKVANSDGYPIYKIFEKIIYYTGKDDISIFVSDCILSFSNNEIRKNPEISRQKIGDLRSTINATFEKAKTKNICASVFGFNSKFYGKYYYYDNTWKDFEKKGITRPYYVWVIGNKDLVKKFDSCLNVISSFNPGLKQINFGIFEKPTQDYKILFNYGKEGEWTAENNGISDAKINLGKGKSITFAIAVDLSNLPVYATEEHFLRNCFQKNEKDAKYTLAVKKISSTDITKALPNEKTALQNNTHIITINVSDLIPSQGLISFEIPAQYDTSYYEWSTMNDKDPNNFEGKTFAFKHLIDGINDAYQNKADKFLNISITIKK